MTDLSVHTPGPLAAASGDPAKRSDGGDSESFLDTILDIVNPLQHLPVVSTLYRSLTGDEISAPARVVGGVLFGGPIGAASAVVNLAVEDATGQDLGEHAMALLTGDDAGDDMQLASLDGTPPPAQRRMPVMVAYGDHAAMMPDYETWNGEWQSPAGAGMQHAAAAAPQPPLPPTAQTATPAPATATTTAQAAEQTAGPVSAPGGPLQQQPPAAQAPAPPPSTAAANAPQPPAWLAAALADAEAQAGGNAARIEPAGDDPASPEWISAAMAHALDKYQAMAVARTSERNAARAAAGAGNN